MGTAPTMSVAFILALLIVLVLPMVGGIILIFRSRRRGRGFPACGHCGYNVTGTLGTSNARCPECGSDFGMVGITPAITQRSKPALMAGIALILVPATCILGSLLTTRATYRARQAAVIAQQAATAQAQAQAMAQQTQLAGAPADPALVATFRPKASRMTQLQAADRASELLEQISQNLANQTLTAENAASLRAEYEAMNERAVMDDGPAIQP
jgi:hypothetical protein